MDGFCWLTGPELCGKLDFTLPVVEIFFMALVSGGVTWATIYFSVKQARKETDRALENAREIAENDRQLAGVFQARTTFQVLAEDANAAFFSKAENHSSSPQALAAALTLVSSGVPHADAAANWVRNFASFNVRFSAIEKHFPGKVRPPADYLVVPTGPGAEILFALTNWASDPEVVGPHLQEMNRLLTDWTINNFGLYSMASRK